MGACALSVRRKATSDRFHCGYKEMIAEMVLRYRARRVHSFVVRCGPLLKLQPLDRMRSCLRLISRAV